MLVLSGFITMRTAKFISSGLLVFMGVYLWSGCSTEKNNIFTRSSHNLSSHYNGYFNSRERVKKGEQQLWDIHEDKFDRVLNVYRHGDTIQAKTVSKLMDDAIKKSSLVIKRHSMLIKGKEYCKWIDENYMLVGKAKYYKRDYFPAIEIFQYVASQYPKSPSHFEAMTWLIITYIQTGNQLEAESLVEFLKNENKIPGELKGPVAAANAYFYIVMKNYPHAIEQLKIAVAHSHKKQLRSRYKFILAQLLQIQGENQEAYGLYGKVIKMNPAYDMAFNAKINRARVFNVDSKDNVQVKKELQKMLRDGKNKDYFDQIYYALAGIAFKEGDTTKGVELLHKSISASTKNASQKAISYQDLAKFYFVRRDYRQAEAYYDSTATCMPKDHPDYESVKNRKEVLDKLIKNLNLIASEDSLRALSGLSEKEREKMIDKAIAAAEKEAEEKKKADNNTKNQGSSFAQGIGAPTAGGTSGQWYFYNTSALSFCFTEYSKKWGDRKL